MKYKSILLYEIILLIFTVFVKIFINENFINYAIIAFWLLSVIVLYNILGFKKKSINIKRDVIQIVIIVLMFYILLTNLSGLILGFLRSIYSQEFIKIINNTYVIFIMIICQELIRYMIGGKDKKGLIYLTILYILFDFAFYYTNSMSKDMYLTFVFATTQLLPMAGRHIVSSYLSYKISYIPGLILRLYFDLSIFILPIFPDLGNFINSVLGVLLPYIIYYNTSKMIVRAEKERIPALNKQLYYLYIPFIAFMLFVVCLTTGLFKYHMIAIASGSMEPVIYRGDAIIYEKTKNPNEVKKGEVVVFKHDGKFISHRIISIEKEDDRYIIQTKGDNNKEKDNYVVSLDEIEGVIKSRIPFIGYPTVWFQELVN